MSNDTETSGEKTDKDLTDSELEMVSGGAYNMYANLVGQKAAQFTPTPPPPPPPTK